MRSLQICVWFLCLFQLAVANGSDSPIVNLKALAKTINTPDSQGRSFVIDNAVVITQTSRLYDTFAVNDGTGYLRITDGMFWPKRSFSPGDRLRMSGTIVKQETYHYNYAKATNIVILAHGIAPAPVKATASEINAGQVLDQLVHTEGRVVDVFHDEIDPRFVFLILADESGFVYVSLPTENITDDKSVFNLLDAVVGVTGLCLRSRFKKNSRLIDISMQITSPAAIATITPPPTDPFSAPIFDSHIHEILQFPGTGTFRRKIRGSVIAVWGGNTALLKTEDDTYAKVGFPTKPLPTCGDFIEAVGTPETDLYSLNLSRAIWRPAEGRSLSEPQAKSISVKELFTNNMGAAAINQRFHGQLLTLSGKVHSLPTIGNERLILACDNHTLPIDFSATPEALSGIEISCTISVTGICVMETENWRPQLPFPQIKGIFLVIRTPHDIRILSRPSWWTPARLLLIIAILVAALVTVGIWNQILKKIIEQRSRELYREQIIRTRREMQTEERTRLAVELHDTLAQNLTGASFEINAAERLVPSDANTSLKHLGRAARTLKSCRDELRNCIWDLRNRALEAPDMNTAIRSTLEPHIGDTLLSVRFNVPRTIFTDNSAHALFRIIRELTLNAIRHGNAKSVKVAGNVEGGQLFFSVRDNGSGFDPENCPGLREGHFGLQGVRERIKKFNGKLSIKSHPGFGTRVAMSMAIPTDNNNKI